MLYHSDVHYCKTWRLKQWRRNANKSLECARNTTNRIPHKEWIIEDLERELRMINAELKERKMKHETNL